MHRNTDHTHVAAVRRGRVCLRLCLAVALGFAAGGCDGAPAPDDAEAGLVAEVEAGAPELADAGTASAAVVAAVDLPDGGAITFVDAGDDAILVVSDARESGGVLGFLMDEYDPTPLELFLYFAADAEPPAQLVVNHRAELTARGLEPREPRSFVVPRVTFPGEGWTNNYTRCDEQALWQADWQSSFGARDVLAAASYTDTNFYGQLFNFYSGVDDVQRVNWGVCLSGRYINQAESISFKFYRRNGAFDWGCGDSGWTVVPVPNEVTTVYDDSVRTFYYYAGAIPDKTCIRVWANSFGLSDTMNRDFGAAVAYDRPLGL